jgi:hypothetical protein
MAEILAVEFRAVIEEGGCPHSTPSNGSYISMPP